MTFTVVLYFLVFAAAVAFAFYKIEGYLIAKIAMMIALFYTSAAIVFSFNTYMGWPAPDSEAPDRMVMTSVVIFDKTKTDPGSIYVMGIPCSSKKLDECLKSDKDTSLIGELTAFKVFGYSPQLANTPRLYTFPYTEENRKMFGEAQENMQNGGRSVFRRGAKKGGEGEGNGQEGDEETSGKGKAQKGEGTRNAETIGAQDIFVDNINLRDILKKD